MKLIEEVLAWFADQALYVDTPPDVREARATELLARLGLRTAEASPPMMNCAGCIESEDGHFVSGPDKDCDECGGTGKVEAMVLTAEEAAAWLADRPPCRAASASVCEDFGCETHPSLAKVVGKWPGDETDAEIQAAMTEMRKGRPRTADAQPPPGAVWLTPEEYSVLLERANIVPVGIDKGPRSASEPTDGWRYELARAVAIRCGVSVAGALRWFAGTSQPHEAMWPQILDEVAGRRRESASPANESQAAQPLLAPDAAKGSLPNACPEPRACAICAATDVVFFCDACVTKAYASAPTPSVDDDDRCACGAYPYESHLAHCALWGSTEGSPQPMPGHDRATIEACIARLEARAARFRYRAERVDEEEHADAGRADDEAEELQAFATMCESNANELRTMLVCAVTSTPCAHLRQLQADGFAPECADCHITLDGRPGPSSRAVSMPLDEVQELVVFERKAERDRTIEECAKVCDDESAEWKSLDGHDEASALRTAGRRMRAGQFTRKGGGT